MHELRTKTMVPFVQPKVKAAHQPIVFVLRGKVKQNFYDENGQLTESFEVSAGSSSTPSINSGTGSPQVVGFSVELGRWHNTECLESGTVIQECKDGR